MGSIPTRSRQSRALSPIALLAAGILLAGVVPGAIAAQEPEPAPRDTAAAADADTTGAIADDARPNPLRAPQEIAPAAPDTLGRPVSPLGALGRSLLVPGWGQATVGEPERGAVYFVLEAASLWMVFKTQAKLNAARRGLPADSELVSAREQQREDWIALAAFWALFSGVDAWVATHLWGFEGEVRPPPGAGLGMELSYSVPVRFP